MSDKQERYKKLYDLILKERIAYSDGQQSIDEHTLDMLKKEALELLKNDQSLVEFGNVNAVFSTKIDEFKKAAHSEPMISMDDVFNFEELSQWNERNISYAKKDLGLDIASASFIAEHKIDGLSIALRYKNKRLIQAITRGNGKEGEDVTHNAFVINGVPHEINFEGDLEVRGEVFIKKNDFKQLLERFKKSNEPLPANPRNLASGSLKLLDSKITKERMLSFSAYICIEPKFLKHSDEHNFLKTLGFPVSNYYVCKNLEQVETLQKKLEESENRLEYLADGIVLQYDDNFIFSELGIVGKSHRGRVAYKFKAEDAATLVKSVEWQVGRTGNITPVATFEPVLLAGSTVSKASLHSLKTISELDVKIGDTVEIIKSGDIIPKVIRVFKELRSESSAEIEIPTHCPSCKLQTFKSENNAILVCKNKLCPEQVVQKLVYFASKECFNFENVGEALVRKFYEKGLISEFADFWKLKSADLMNLEGFKDALSEKIVKNISKVKSIPLWVLLKSLSIDGLGSKLCQNLAKHIFRFEGETVLHKLRYLSEETVLELSEIELFAEKTSQAASDWFSSPSNLQLIENIVNQGVKIEIEDFDESKGIVVFTGTLSKPRSQMTKAATKKGYGVGSQLTKFTTFLVAGSEAGSKLEKAKKLKIKILNEEEFENLQ